MFRAHVVEHFRVTSHQGEAGWSKLAKQSLFMFQVMWSDTRTIASGQAILHVLHCTKRGHSKHLAWLTPLLGSACFAPHNIIPTPDLDSLDAVIVVLHWPWHLHHASTSCCAASQQRLSTTAINGWCIFYLEHLPLFVVSKQAESVLSGIASRQKFVIIRTTYNR